MLLVSTKSSICLSEAQNAFARSYKTSNFIVKGPFLANEQNGIDDTNKIAVQMKHFKTIKNIIRTFGHLIQIIKISFYYMEEAIGAEIVSFVSDNCTESLLVFHLNDCYGQILSKWTKSFRTVYEASISTDAYRVLKNQSLTIQMDKIMPNLQRLSVKITNANDWQIVGNKFLHLISLNVELPEPTRNNRPNVENLLKNSRKINSLSISYTSLDILKAAHDFLLNLNVLNIYGFSNDAYDGNRIKFKNISHVTIVVMDENKQIAEMLAFDHIRAVSLQLQFDFSDEWSSFFKNLNGKTIENFDISANSFTGKQLSIIAQQQSNIKMASITSRTPVSADEIVDFVGRCHKMVFFQLNGRFINANECALLAEYLQDNWTVSINYHDNDYLAVSLDRYEHHLLIFH